MKAREIRRGLCRRVELTCTDVKYWREQFRVRIWQAARIDSFPVFVPSSLPQAGSYAELGLCESSIRTFKGPEHTFAETSRVHREPIQISVINAIY